MSEVRPAREFVNCRGDFPALQRVWKSRPLAFFDGPGGTQVPRAVVDAIGGYYATCNANTHGEFVTSRESDAASAAARQAAADLLGAEGPQSVSFGANMTTLNFALSHAIARVLRPGDEVLITQLDHEANRGPWLGLRERGVVVREVRLRPDGTLDMEDFEAKLGEKTRLVAMGYASNALGTVNDAATVRRWTWQCGAWLLLDAVHYAPHLPLGVAELGADFLLCSAYKFYGPHVGILYSREGLLDQLPTDRLRTQDPVAPWRIETGTLNHAALAGVTAAVDFLASFGVGPDRRSRLREAYARLGEHERDLVRRLEAGLREIPGGTVYGPPVGQPPRAPTLAFTLAGRHPEEVCRHLGERGICAWNGHFYAIRAMEVLGLLTSGGVVRIGIAMYNTPVDVSRLLESLREIA